MQVIKKNKNEKKFIQNLERLLKNKCMKATFHYSLQNDHTHKRLHLMIVEINYMQKHINNLYQSQIILESVDRIFFSFAF